MNVDKKRVISILKVGLPVPRFLRPIIRGVYYAGVFTVEALIVLRKLFWVEPVLRSVCAHVGRRLRADRLPYIRGSGRLIIGDDVRLSGRSSFFFMSGMPDVPIMEIGNNVFIGSRCALSCAKRIRIGDNVLVAGGTRISDNDGHPLDAGKRMAGERMSHDHVEAVEIENNVWIGAEVIVLKGTRIGRNAVVGAGSVVLHDVLPDTVVAGNPAVVVKSLPRVV